MNSCNEDLYDCELVKKCSEGRNVQLKSHFDKQTLSKSCLFSQCKSCVIQKQKFMFLKIEKELKNIKNYIKNRIKTDINFRLLHNTRGRIHHALNGKSKSSSTSEIFGSVIEF